MKRDLTIDNEREKETAIKFRSAFGRRFTHTTIKSIKKQLKREGV